MKFDVGVHIVKNVMKNVRKRAKSVERGKKRRLARKRERIYFRSGDSFIIRGAYREYKRF